MAIFDASPCCRYGERVKVIVGNIAAFVAVAVLIFLLQQMLSLAVLYAMDPAAREASDAELMLLFRETVLTTLWPFPTIQTFNREGLALLIVSVGSVVLSLLGSLAFLSLANLWAGSHQHGMSAHQARRTRLSTRKQYVNLESVAGRIGVILILSGAFLVPGALLSLSLFGEAADLRSIKGQELLIVLDTNGAEAEPLELMFRRYGSFDSGGDDIVMELIVQSEDVSITGFQVYARNLDNTNASTWCYAQRADGETGEREYFSDPIGELPDDVASLVADTSIFGQYYQFDDQWPDGDGWTRPFTYADTDGVPVSGIHCETYGVLAPLYANSVRYFPPPLLAVAAPGHDEVEGQFQDHIVWPGEWDHRDVRASSDESSGTFGEGVHYLGNTALGGRFDPFMAIDTIDESTSTRLAWLGALLLGAWLSGVLAILLDATIGVARAGQYGRPVPGQYGPRPPPPNPTPLDRRRLKFRRRFIRPDRT
jgi:hypothetical protein